jgi:hypothetical protein
MTRLLLEGRHAETAVLILQEAGSDQGSGSIEVRARQRTLDRRLLREWVAVTCPIWPCHRLAVARLSSGLDEAVRAQLSGVLSPMAISAPR